MKPPPLPPSPPPASMGVQKYQTHGFLFKSLDQSRAIAAARFACCQTRLFSIPRSFDFIFPIALLTVTEGEKPIYVSTCSKHYSQRYCVLTMCTRRNTSHSHLPLFLPLSRYLSPPSPPPIQLHVQVLRGNNSRNSLPVLSVLGQLHKSCASHVEKFKLPTLKDKRNFYLSFDDSFYSAFVPL